MKTGQGSQLYWRFKYNVSVCIWCELVRGKETNEFNSLSRQLKRVETVVRPPPLLVNAAVVFVLYQ